MCSGNVTNIPSKQEAPINTIRTLNSHHIWSVKKEASRGHKTRYFPWCQ